MITTYIDRYSLIISLLSTIGERCLISSSLSYSYDRKSQISFYSLLNLLSERECLYIVLDTEQNSFWESNNNRNIISLSKDFLINWSNNALLKKFKELLERKYNSFIKRLNSIIDFLRAFEYFVLYIFIESVNKVRIYMRKYIVNALDLDMKYLLIISNKIKEIV